MGETDLAEVAAARVARAAFERDHRRDQTLTAAGYTVIRTTWTAPELSSGA